MGAIVKNVHNQVMRIYMLLKQGVLGFSKASKGSVGYYFVL